PGAVYARHGVRIITFDTLHDYLVEGVEPLIYAAPGGFYVNIDGARLRALREERGLSLGDLAQAAGVSRRAIGMYEEGMGAMVDVAARLEAFLDEALAMPYNPFRAEPWEEAPRAPSADDAAAGFEGTVLRAMRELGFQVATTTRSPFAAIGKDGSGERRPDDAVVLTGFGGDAPDVAKRAAATANLCDVTETWGVFFVERRTTRVAIEGTPVVSREEVARMDAPEDLIRVLQERRGRKR
ncbi:MAG TPA: helix-turn-helix domain-containing protein, partial [Candidatus Thermoplasmatota archaeon]|nr:helix-turn-helix domain-containing protein [Candidatus Thermoplasmatota archaeon]